MWFILLKLNYTQQVELLNICEFVAKKTILLLNKIMIPDEL
jgi:hypothetical protein